MQNIFAVHVKDRPGVLNRVASLFRRRGFNLESVAVGHSERLGVSRMTLGVEIEDGRDWHLEANLYRLQDVLSVKNLTLAQPVTREMALIRLSLNEASRAYFTSLSKDFRPQVVDFTADSMVLEISQAPEAIDELVEALRPLGILEMVRSGQIALATAPTATKRATGTCTDLELESDRTKEKITNEKIAYEEIKTETKIKTERTN
jgi:acetolactate synthase I/III small subunit